MRGVGSKYHYKKVFPWGADDGPTLNAIVWKLCDFQGIWTIIAKKPYIFVGVWRGGGGFEAAVDVNSIEVIGFMRMFKGSSGL